MSLFRLFGKTEKIAKSDPKGCLGCFHGVGFGLYNLKVVSWGGGSGGSNGSGREFIVHGLDCEIETTYPVP